ncbi:hypothetical protein OG562_19080 [Streptomyces sp. NBC_01275]|uniref:hypothetical protein n=1 Tax=Streptomyces sp. NBC_01275 TaxID=2903807 RepID=UPI00224FC7BB|nr:hypothetical protein [Streptomyces sp. NBC_01275]MCX4763045.1 hypothetical protein [Streptomyces sp. NBC_01275]
MSVLRWATGVGAVVVLVGTGGWVMWPAADVDARLWGEVRPVIEAGLVAEARGSGYGETEPALESRWFCRADALDLAEHEDEVRAGVNTLCVEYGVRGDSLVECSGAQFPQVVRLKRDADADGGYRIVSREEAPDGEGNAGWTKAHFGVLAAWTVQDEMSSQGLETAARAHFGLPADASVGDC